MGGGGGGGGGAKVYAWSVQKFHAPLAPSMFIVCEARTFSCSLSHWKLYYYTCISVEEAHLHLQCQRVYDK